MGDLHRIQKELREVKRDESLSGVSIELLDSNLKHMKGTISGPSDSPYEGGMFSVDIVLPEDYPFEPPKMRFISRVWHPNVSSQNGAICLDILKDQWSPALTLKAALLSLQALLSAPQPDDPQDAVVADQYLKDYDAFCRTAKHWTENYASAKGSLLDEKVVKLVEMGFTKQQAEAALESSGGDESVALDILFGSNGVVPDAYVDDGLYTQEVSRLVSMGFDAHAARKALGNTEGDEERALDELVQS